MIKEGAGTLVLSGNSTFTSAVTVNAGTLKLGAAGTSPNGPLGTTAGATTVNAGAALDLNGLTLGTAEPVTLFGTGVGGAGALTNSSATAATFSGPVTLGSGGATLGGTGAITLSSALVANAEPLVKAGANTVILAADSTRTGTWLSNSRSSSLPPWGRLVRW